MLAQFIPQNHKTSCALIQPALVFCLRLQQSCDFNNVLRQLSNIIIIFCMAHDNFYQLPILNMHQITRLSMLLSQLANS